MIDLGLIAKGPGLMRRPIVRDIRTLGAAFRAGERETLIELVYIIPGRLGRADFNGFELARSRAGNRHHIVFVEVPSEVVTLDEPMEVVAALGRRAIEFARATLPKSKAPLVDFREALRVFDSVAGRVVGPDYAPGKPPSVHESALQLQSVPDQVSRANAYESVVVSLAVPDPSSLDQAFDFEQALHRSLEGSGIGYVDGNEIGEGAFAVFIYGPSLTRLRRVVDSVLAERWTQGSATISVQPGDRD